MQQQRKHKGGDITCEVKALLTEIILCVLLLLLNLLLLLGRVAHIAWMQHIATNVARSVVCLCVCLLGT